MDIFNQFFNYILTLEIPYKQLYILIFISYFLYEKFQSLILCFFMQNDSGYVKQNEILFGTVSKFINMFSNYYVRFVSLIKDQSFLCVTSISDLLEKIIIEKIAGIISICPVTGVFVYENKICSLNCKISILVLAQFLSFME